MEIVSVSKYIWTWLYIFNCMLMLYNWRLWLYNRNFYFKEKGWANQRQKDGDRRRKWDRKHWTAFLGFSSFPHCPLCVVVPASSACPPLPPSLFSSLALALPSRPFFWWRGAASWFHYGDSVDGRVRYCDSANRIVVLLSEGLPRPATRFINSPTKRETRAEAENREASSPLPPPNSSSVRTAGLFTPGKPIIPKESYSLAFPFISVTVARLGFKTMWAVLLSTAYMSNHLQRKWPDWTGNS